MAKQTVRHLMTNAGLWIPRRPRPPKTYKPRAQRACLRKLIQIDRLDHRWFEERARLAAAGVRRRCDQPADGAAFHDDRIDVPLPTDMLCRGIRVRRS